MQIIPPLRSSVSSSMIMEITCDSQPFKEDCKINFLSLITFVKLLANFLSHYKHETSAKNSSSASDIILSNPMSDDNVVGICHTWDIQGVEVAYTVGI